MSLEHLIREPAGEPEGALVLSHGRGTSEHDLFPLIDELDPERRLLGIAPGAPLTGIPPGGSTGTWSSGSATRPSTLKRHRSTHFSTLRTPSLKEPGKSHFLFRSTNTLTPQILFLLPAL